MSVSADLTRPVSVADEATEWPLVSVCIVAYNRAAELAQTLPRMHALDYPADRLEFILVDNASSDGTAEMVRREFPDVQVLVNEENIGAPAWNRAFAQARGDWILILDDDCYLKPDAMRKAIATAERESASLVSLAIVSAEDESYRFDREYPTGLITFWGCAAFVRREAIETAGGYDPNIFIWGNEVEMTMRLLDHGYAHLHLPEAVAVHMKTPASMRVFNAGGRRMNARHFAYSSAKHLRALDASMALGNLLFTAALFSLQRPASAADIPAVLGGARDGLRVRRAVRAEVSRLYRRNFIEIGTPLRFIRGPRTRWRSRRRPRAGEDEFAARLKRYARQRGALYPERPTLLKV